MGSIYTVRREVGVVRVDLFGALREDPLRALEAELQALARVEPKGTHAVIVSTSALVEADERSRQALVRVQKELAAWARRSVWIDGRAAFRGMALWVMHLADDQNCKAVATEAAAATWLSGSEPREEQASKRATGGAR